MIGIGLLALVLYPGLRHAWDVHRFHAQARCLRDIYVASAGAIIEAEAKGLKSACPQTLSEILDEKAKAELKRNGIDWRQIQYVPFSDDAPDCVALLTVEVDGYIIVVRKGGAIFRARKEYADRLQSTYTHP